MITNLIGVISFLNDKLNYIFKNIFLKYAHKFICKHGRIFDFEFTETPFIVNIIFNFYSRNLEYFLAFRILHVTRLITLQCKFSNNLNKNTGMENHTSVSYTHLDVYKRQPLTDLHQKQ